MFGRKKLGMLVAEFLGTAVLTLVVLSVQRSQLGLAYFVALAAGIAVAALTYTFGAVSGAQMNPALTLGLMTARRVKFLPGVLYIVVQLLGAWAAYGLYHYFVNTDVQVVRQAFTSRIMVAEAIATVIFTLAWASAAYNRLETSRFATVAGLGFIVAQIVASSASVVGLANPALALGVRAWAFWGSNGWMNYALGPVLGALIGVNLYALLFAEADQVFGFMRRKPATATVANTVSSSIDEDDELDEDEEEIDVDKTINKNARLGKVAEQPVTKVSRSKKSSTAKKVAAKKKR